MGSKIQQTILMGKPTKTPTLVHRGALNSAFIDPTTPQPTNSGPFVEMPWKNPYLPQTEQMTTSPPQLESSPRRLRYKGKKIVRWTVDNRPMIALSSYEPTPHPSSTQQGNSPNLGTMRSPQPQISSTLSKSSAVLLKPDWEDVTRQRVAQRKLEKIESARLDLQMDQLLQEARTSNQSIYVLKARVPSLKPDHSPILKKQLASSSSSCLFSSSQDMDSCLFPPNS